MQYVTCHCMLQKICWWEKSRTRTYTSNLNCFLPKRFVSGRAPVPWTVSESLPSDSTRLQNTAMLLDAKCIDLKFEKPARIHSFVVAFALSEKLVHLGFVKNTELKNNQKQKQKHVSRRNLVQKNKPVPDPNHQKIRKHTKVYRIYFQICSAGFCTSSSR